MNTLFPCTAWPAAPETASGGSAPPASFSAPAVSAAPGAVPTAAAPTGESPRAAFRGLPAAVFPGLRDLPAAAFPGLRGLLPAAVSPGLRGLLPAAVSPGLQGLLPAAACLGLRGLLPAAAFPGLRGLLPAAVFPGLRGLPLAAAFPGLPAEFPRSGLPGSSSAGRAGPRPSRRPTVMYAPYASAPGTPQARPALPPGTRWPRKPVSAPSAHKSRVPPAYRLPRSSRREKRLRFRPAHRSPPARTPRRKADSGRPPIHARCPGRSGGRCGPA